MNGVRQFFRGGDWKRRGVIALILTCWAVQGAFYWGSSEHQRVDAALDRDEQREQRGFGDMSVEQLERLRESIQTNVAVGAKGSMAAGKTEDPDGCRRTALEDHEP